MRNSVALGKPTGGKANTAAAEKASCQVPWISHINDGPGPTF